MYTRPNTLAPALLPAPPLQSPGNPQQQPHPHHSQQRFYELLDALKAEYDTVAHTSHPSMDSSNKMSLVDYEGKVQQQAAELNHIQKTILELERVFHRMKQEYEEEIARLKRGDEIAEDHRPLLPSSTAGNVALAGLSIGEKRGSTTASLTQEDIRNVRSRDNTASAIGDIAQAAMASAGSISTTSSSPLTASSAYDWIVTYNPKAQRLLSINLLQSFNFEGVVCCVRFSNSGNYLAASGNKLCNIYDAKTGQLLVSIPHDSADGGDLYVRSLSFNSTDNLFATGSEDNCVRIWDVSSLPETPKLIQTLKGHTQDVYALEFFDEKLIVTGSGDQNLKLWNALSGDCVATIKNESTVDEAGAARESGITSLSISPDRKFIVTGSLDRLVRVFQISSDQKFKLIETFAGHEDSVYSVTFDQSDSTVISGSLDRTIRKWSLTSSGGGAGSNNHCLQVISNHRDFVLSVAVSNSKSPERSFIISGSKDRSVQFWDETGQCNQLNLQGHKNSVISVAICPTGNVFATGSGDGRARIWSFTNKSEN